MDTAAILGVFVAGPIALGVGILRWAPDAWLRGFAELGRSLGRLM